MSKSSPNNILSQQKKSVCQEAVFDELFLSHATDIRNFCYYKCQDLEAAEDYVQEAFIQLWKNCAKVPFQKAKSFLMKVAQNRFLDQVAHQKVKLRFVRKQVPKINLEHPQFQIEEKELLDRLEEAINALSEKQRVVFLLHRIDGKSYKEIAGMLGISVKSVEKRIHRALLSLRNCLPQL
ncbi:MAG: sigma-70 family RNA polymerase sigma factor [Bacteroidota bacterium]